jgi:nucleotide-binding universal stress UspA family protein
VTSAAIAPQGNAPPAGSSVLQYGPIIVATDGSEGSDAALQTAGRLAALLKSKVVVLSAVEPVGAVAGDFEIARPFHDLEQALRAERMTKVLAQLERVGDHNAGWTMNIEYGEPAYSIATVAQDLDATMVITGLGSHELLDRLFGGETTIRIVRASKSPVLAVASRFDELPKRAVVATDFSVASLNSARAAVRLFPSITTISLVHVLARLEVPPDAFVTWAEQYSEPISTSFERFTSALDLPPSIIVETITLE